MPIATKLDLYKPRLKS